MLCFTFYRSSPQLLIALYVIVVGFTYSTKPVSFSVWASFSLSLLSIVKRFVDEDKLSLEGEWKTSRCVNINFAPKFSCTLGLKYHIRAIWRMLDVSGRFSILAIFWFTTNGYFVLGYVFVQFIILDIIE